MKPTRNGNRITYLHGARLSLTPWANAALSVEDQKALTERCAALGIRVSVGNSNHEWTLRLTRDGADRPTLEWFHQKGRPAPLVHHLLDQYEDIARSLADDVEAANRWTPDELVTIANQSGLDVSRA
jgi:hypothetical protein